METQKVAFVYLFIYLDVLYTNIIWPIIGKSIAQKWRLLITWDITAVTF